MVQWVLDGWFSLGIHVDLKRRRTVEGVRFAPYCDLYLGMVVVSLGVRPHLSGDLERALGISRGGIG